MSGSDAPIGRMRIEGARAAVADARHVRSSARNSDGPRRLGDARGPWTALRYKEPGSDAAGRDSVRDGSSRGTRAGQHFVPTA